MPSPPKSPASLTRTILAWSRAHAKRHGIAPTVRRLAGKIFKFALDSTPSRRRARYGDVDFDWDTRVDTTSATVLWADRLHGLFHSPYQPTEPALFREMLQALPVDFPRFTFLDIGSGKGRTLLMASDFPFQRVVGVEILPALDRVAKQNLAVYRSAEQKCFQIESWCGDACELALPAEPLVLYLFNPLPEDGLRRLLSRLDESLERHPRPIYIVYHHPLLEPVLAETRRFGRVSRTAQYAIYSNRQ